MTPKDDSLDTHMGTGKPPSTLPLNPPEQQPSSPPDYQSSIVEENEDENMPEESIYDDKGEPKFPNEELLRLEEQINRVRWTVPVLDKGELIICLRAAVRLAKERVDTKSDPCQRLIRESIVSSFRKVCCDDAVQGWKYDILYCIYKNILILIHLSVLKLEDDCLPLLEVLSFTMDPFGRFHQANYNRPVQYRLQNGNEPFASLQETRMSQQGWLVDFINRFGDLGGFDKLVGRFCSSQTKLTVPTVVALIKPWGLSYEYLTRSTIQKFFAPIIEFVPQFLDQLTETDLKFEAKSENKSDTLSTVIKWLRNLASRVPENSKTCQNLDTLRLKMILRLLQTNSFNGKMHALNEVNKLIASLSPANRISFGRTDETEGLTAEYCMKWIKDNEVLDIVLRDCLHQPQYVEKLEKLLRFLIKEQGLSRTDLDKIWAASCGKHEAIEKNVHDLLAKLAWDFSPSQLEQLFDCFRESWTKASKKQREKLLELIRRLAEDDKEGLMASKVLELLWTIAHDKNLPNEIIDQALAAHLKILDYSCLSDKEKTKISWIDRIMDEIKNDQHVIISMKHMREICSQFSEHVYSHNISRISAPQNRLGLIDILEKKHGLIRVITENLCHYMDTTRQFRQGNRAVFALYSCFDGFPLPETEVMPAAEEHYPDGRFNHNEQICERLNFLKFLLKEGRLFLTSEVSKMIWRSLAEQAVYPNDRQQCFRWFAEIVDEVGLEPKAEKDFFENHLMKLEPHLLTDLGMNCFDRFFKSVNADLKKLEQKRRSIRLINHEDLVGIEYLWKLILDGSDDVSDRSTHLIKEIFTNINPPLKADVKHIHEAFLADCFQRLKLVYASLQTASKQSDPNAAYEQRLTSLIRILIVLREYVAECDNSYHKDRSILPMSRAFRGRSVLLLIRVNTGQARSVEEFEHACHSNETWGQIRRMINNRNKTAFGMLEMVRNNELVSTADDNRTLGQTDERDRIPVSARWVQQPIHGGSSAESSSSESERNNTSSLPSRHGRTHNHQADVNTESALPSVIFSQNHEYCQFLIDICDSACRQPNDRLRDTVRQILDSIPLDKQATTALNSCFVTPAPHPRQLSCEESSNQLNQFFFGVSPSQMLYNLKAILINLMPAHMAHVNDVLPLHVRFLNSGGLTNVLNILTEKKFNEQCDIATRKSIYLTMLHILKRFLIVLGFRQLQTAQPTVASESLDQILSLMPMTTIVEEPQPQQHVTTSLEKRIAAAVIQHAQDYPIPSHSFLQYEHILEIIRLIWRLASNSAEMNFDRDLNSIHQSFQQESAELPGVPAINEYADETDESQLACREALELLCLSIALVPSSVERLLKEDFFDDFLIDLVLYSPYSIIRQTAGEQIYLLTSRCSQGLGEQLSKYLIDKQFQIVNAHSKNLQSYSSQSNEFFLLLSHLLSFACANQILPSNIDEQLTDEINWLKNIALPVDEHLLRGHLNLAKELLQFQSYERKRFYGMDQQLIEQLIEQFLFPASISLYQMHAMKQKRLAKPETETVDDEFDLLKEPAVPICQTSASSAAAFDLLVVLGTGCIDNLKLIDKYNTDLFYTVTDTSLHEWDFALPVGPRPTRGFVGLKNAGATCYMNSVLQQLFMIRPLRTALLSVKIPAEHLEEDIDDEEVRRENPFDPSLDTKSTPKEPVQTTPLERSEYNVQILRHIQRLFGHLLESKLQFYIPRGFWKIFKFAGEPVNVREQQDAVEFLNTLVDCLDEALKTLNLPQICSRVLGGKFADQKICKDCPHRYSREEDFTLLSVDIRHSQNLKESLEQYVIGELLDGPNAYFCEKCNKKVDTVKRTCFKKLPPILAIQLKRFDYDWERETPIKFNDYFEFPRELDMDPYTVQGLAKAEGTPVIDDNPEEDQSTAHGNRYKLVGIIVHMGQANGGHYYSFIQNKSELDALDYSQWYKFDDTDVSECRMDDDEELRSQCFGGDNPASAFDQSMMKRQRRWWNAYILFYERISTAESNSVDQLTQDLSQLRSYDESQRMPLSVLRSVRKQNIKFLHNRIHFSPEYFLFMKKLVQSNVQYMIKAFQQQLHVDKHTPANTIDELAMVTIQIAAKFLFSIGWRTKKSVRGPANEWTDVIAQCIRLSRQARFYLAEEVLLQHPQRFQEYLIDCTSAEVRGAFVRILVGLASNSRLMEDGPIASANNMTIEESILQHVLRLLKKDVPESVKMLGHCFQFFISYSALGRYECEQLIRLNVPTLLVTMANDDHAPLSSSLTRYGEPEKLFVILSTLLRCFDVSMFCKSKEVNKEVLPNPYYTHETGPICSIPDDLIEIIYKRDNFIKRIIEDSASEETLRLLRFLVWENSAVTAMVFNEIITLLSLYFTCDLRAHWNIINTILIMEDSWQEVRILCILKGTYLADEITVTKNLINDNSVPSITTNHHVHEAGQSFFDIFAKLKSSHQKRGYQFIKNLVHLFSNCPKAHHLLRTDQDLNVRWTQAVHWLEEQLERAYPPNQTNYSYYSSQGQAVSNDQSQSYYLERTQSTKTVLDAAVRLCPDLVTYFDDGASNSDDMADDEELIQSMLTNPRSNSPSTLADFTGTPN